MRPACMYLTGAAAPRSAARDIDAPLVNALHGIQSALNPQSPQASAIAELAWLLIGGAAAIFAVVMVLAALAVWRRPRWLGSRNAIVIGGIAVPMLVLSGLLVHSVTRMGGLTDRGDASLRVEVVGKQWWWRVRYLTASGATDFETANELRVPAGSSVEVALASDDVLHSFWVPNLAGKLDLVPGRVNRLRFTATNTGTWRGQCAEYCGGPHALMAFHVIALPVADFERWAERQRAPAATPPPPAFTAHCAVCHTVRGTPAGGDRGPDLTHVGGRIALAAGILPNNRQALATWITSSQHVKPGNLMPSFRTLPAVAVAELAAYLEGLE